MANDSTGVSLSVRAERKLIRPTGSKRHIAFSVRVSEFLPKREREPLTITLVIDRSGSMHGEKMEAARKAASLVIRSLDERDEFSVVSFDEKIDILFPRGSATRERKREATNAIEKLEARGSTALHEGWLTGCTSIAGSEIPRDRVMHCFLLTDGMANVGIQDPEAIASQAAGVRINAGIRTSTFGIGADYDENLLAPMAVAGGGQFHHLREAVEIERSFSGELGDLFSVAARNVRLELESTPDVDFDSVSDYHLRRDPQTGVAILDIGDLQSEEERHAVVRCRFPRLAEGGVRTVRCRLLWESGGQPRESGTGDVVFLCASQEECSAEEPDPDALHWVGMHHAARTKRIAMDLLRRKGGEAAVRLLERAVSRFSAYPITLYISIFAASV